MAIEAPSDERDGNRWAEPKAAATSSLLYRTLIAYCHHGGTSDIMHSSVVRSKRQMIKAHVFLVPEMNRENNPKGYI